jgi:hypothetical protein
MNPNTNLKPVLNRPTFLTPEDLIIANNKKCIKTDWIAFSRSFKPTFHVTITLKQPKLRLKYINGQSYESKHNGTNYKTSDNQALHAINLLLHYVNESIYGRNYKKNNLFISGVGSLEYQKNQQPHVHLLIHNNITYEKLNYHFIKKLTKFNILDQHGLMIQPVIDTPESIERLSSYDTKLLEKYFTTERMIVLGADGIME